MHTFFEPLEIPVSWGFFYLCYTNIRKFQGDLSRILEHSPIRTYISYTSAGSTPAAGSRSDPVRRFKRRFAGLFVLVWVFLLEWVLER